MFGNNVRTLLNVVFPADERFSGWRRLSTGAYLVPNQVASGRLGGHISGQKALMSDALYGNTEITETAVQQDARGRSKHKTPEHNNYNIHYIRVRTIEQMHIF